MPIPQAISFTVTGKPHAKARPWATSVNGRAHVYTPPGTRTYEAGVRAAAVAALGDHKAFDGAVHVSITMRLQPPQSTSNSQKLRMLTGAIKPTKRPDLDNVVKAIIDGCNGIVFRDDSDIVSIIATKIYAEAPGVDVRVISID